MFDYEKEFLEFESLDRLEWMDYDTRVFKMPVIFKRAIDLVFEYHRLTYSDFGGIKRLRKLVIEYEGYLAQRKTNDKPFSFIGSGVSNLIYPVLQAVFDLDDKRREVVLFSPDYPIFHSVVESAKGMPIVIRSLRENDFLPTVDQLENTVSTRTAAVLFSNPNNPTGKSFSREWVNALVKLSRRYDFFILSDEIYIDSLYRDQQPVHIAGVNGGYKNYVKFFGPSKDRPGMTGIRCGYCVGDKRLLPGIEKIQMVRNISNGIISDYLLLLDIALRYKELSGVKHPDLKYFSEPEITNYTDTISNNMNLQEQYNKRIVAKLKNHPKVKDVIPPDGGNSIFFRYYKDLPAPDFVREFMSKGLATYPGEAFMLNPMDEGSWTRVCVTRDIDLLEKAIEKI
ncbi:MAG: pyridoxal phosphate-dependent aminotransferase [Candidatus Andersenbacteria bacterium]|nr:pyridoxal phosphate-dependent aminotransferase [Candidatus Andersenbacteria bacterium]